MISPVMYKMPPKKTKKSAPKRRTKRVTEYVQGTAPQAAGTAEADHRVDRAAAGLPAPSTAVNFGQLDVLHSFAKAQRDIQSLAADPAQARAAAVLTRSMQPFMDGLEAVSRDPSIKYRLHTDDLGAAMLLAQRAQTMEAEKYMIDLLNPIVERRSKEHQATLSAPTRALKSTSGPSTSTTGTTKPNA